MGHVIVGLVILTLQKKSYQDINTVLHHHSLPFMPEAIWTKLINRHHNDPLDDYFEIDKTQELVARKYLLLMLQHNIETYIKGCDMCFALKTIKHKPYSDFQSLPVPTH